MDVKLFSPSDLGHLSGKCRDVVELAYVAERNTQEIASRLFMSVPTTRSHIRHARRQLAGLRTLDAPAGILLPDRRFALPTHGRVYANAFDSVAAA